MSHHGRTVLPKHDATTPRMRSYYLSERGMLAFFKRADDIEALPLVEWKGKPLRTVRCQGDFGKGPHDQHLPEHLLWSLLSLEHYRCPYHRP